MRRMSVRVTRPTPGAVQRQTPTRGLLTVTTYCSCTIRKPDVCDVKYRLFYLKKLNVRNCK